MVGLDVFVSSLLGNARRECGTALMGIHTTASNGGRYWHGCTICIVVCKYESVDSWNRSSGIRMTMIGAPIRPHRAFLEILD